HNQAKSEQVICLRDFVVSCEVNLTSFSFRCWVLPENPFSPSLIPHRRRSQGFGNSTSRLSVRFPYSICSVYLAFGGRQ
ncbi:hypothetical protein LINPERPRIM_LOCUS27284, partial [Linum perenne]